MASGILDPDYRRPMSYAPAGAAPVQQVAAAGSPALSKAAQDVIASLQQTAPKPGAMPTWNASAAANPTITWATQQMQQRFGGDMGAGQAIDLAGGKIREAAIGLEKGLEADAVRRGVSGTGVEAGLKGRLAGDQLRAIQGAASDISAGREAARDNMLNSVVGAGAAQAGIQGAQNNYALQAWTAAQANQRAAESQRTSTQLAILDLLTGDSRFNAGLLN